MVTVCTYPRTGELSRVLPPQLPIHDPDTALLPHRLDLIEITAVCPLGQSSRNSPGRYSWRLHNLEPHPQ